MKFLSVAALLVAAVGMSGCTNAGGKLAQASRDYGQCQIAEGADCKLASPQGTTVEKTAVTRPDDALRISGEVASESDCKSFAANARPSRHDVIIQAVINDTVVTPYGAIPVPTAIDSACAKAPYRVSMTVAKAP